MILFVLYVILQLSLSFKERNGDSNPVLTLLKSIFFVTPPQDENAHGWGVDVFPQHYSASKTNSLHKALLTHTAVHTNSVRVQNTIYSLMSPRLTSPSALQARKESRKP